MPSSSPSPAYLRVACVLCERTTGTPADSVAPCSSCGGREFVALGLWRAQPGLYSVRQLFERGRIDFDAPWFGRALRANAGGAS